MEGEVQPGRRRQFQQVTQQIRRLDSLGMEQVRVPGSSLQEPEGGLGGDVAVGGAGRDG